MFRFAICQELIRNRIQASRTSCHVCFLQTQSLTKSNTKISNQESLTVSYLINSCGFSLESAISTSKKIKIRSTEKSNSVLELFRTHGFTETQITNVISKFPSLLLSKPDKTLGPKIEFFKSLGLSSPELAAMLSKEPLILQRGLKNHLIPSFNFIRTFVHTNKNLVSVVKRLYPYHQCNVEKAMGPNILILQTHGVPKSNISKLIMVQPSTLVLNTNRFEASVAMAQKMGFDPTSRGFVLAVRSMMVLSKSNWERKMELYKGFGLSEDELLSAFKLQPLFMLTSEEKIKKIMNFIVNKLEWKPSSVLKCPNLLLLSLEKRIIPRCSVIQILMSKGLVKKDINLVTILKMIEKNFVKRFLIKYHDEVPEIVRAHQGKIEFQGFHKESNDVCL